MAQLVIKNGWVIDGTGAPAAVADIAVDNGKITAIGQDLPDGEVTLDATGLTVTPGFIDSHSHSDYNYLTHPDQIEKVEQGITTAVGGQCGTTPAPIGKVLRPEDVYEIGTYGKNTEVYRTIGSYLDIAKTVPQGANQATFAGHAAIRRAVIGTEMREPTAEELEQMKALLNEAMDHGALGISFGLIYAPSCYAKTEELIELAAVAARRNGLMTVHIRSEGDALVEAVEEVLTVARATGVRTVFSHHKAMGKANWGKVKQTLHLIDEAIDEGLDVYMDVYPYNASSTSLSARIVPKEYHVGGAIDGVVASLLDPQKRAAIKEWGMAQWGMDMSWIMITECSGYRQYQGKLVSEIAEIHGKDVYETMYDMLTASRGSVSASYFMMCEDDIEQVLAHPRAMVCTDSSVAKGSKTYHPRLRGSFPRVLGRYVRERGVTTLPEMIRKMTALPAQVYGFTTKGVIREGMDADLCVFDANTIIDRATYAECTLGAEGLRYVIVGGEIAAIDAVYTGKRAGRVLV